jgi:release factor glutamine methyltransferase
LDAAGIAGGRFEARLLLAHALRVDQAGLLRDRDLMIETGVFQPLLARRLAREPLAFITGCVGFWTLSIATSPATLVPRADSETVVEAALAAFPGRKMGRILDLGTGTGCLLLAVLSECPGAFGVGVDHVEQATHLAARNAAANALAGRAAFLCGDWATSLSGAFDLILSNPPYIPTRDIAELMPEVACYEPSTALDGGADGLDAYRLVIAAVSSMLTPDGAAVLELGLGQAEAVAAIATIAGLRVEAVRCDLGGIERAIVLRRALPQKNHLALGQDAVSFLSHGRDGR